jgi:hypothetical protein
MYASYFKLLHKITNFTVIFFIFMFINMHLEFSFASVQSQKMYQVLFSFESWLHIKNSVLFECNILS